MRLLYQRPHRLFELLRLHEEHRSSWLRRLWLAIGWREDELLKKRWPYRILVDLCDRTVFLVDVDLRKMFVRRVVGIRVEKRSLGSKKCQVKAPR